MVEIKEHNKVFSKCAETSGSHSIDLFVGLAPALSFISSTIPLKFTSASCYKVDAPNLSGRRQFTTLNSILFLFRLFL